MSKKSNSLNKKLSIFSMGCIFFWATSALLAVEIAITLDDHPLPDGCIFSTHERVECFCKALEKYDCKAAFFCIGLNCQNFSDTSCLTRLNDAGHFLGNHSFHHRHLSSMSLEEFQNEIEATETILSAYSQFRKWFRFPYLDYGDRTPVGGSKEKFFSAMSLLKECAYQEGFVTINTFDWHINRRLQEALLNNKNVNYSHLKEAYLFLIEDWCSYYIASYENLFLDGVTHVLLLHANDLNALFLEDIFEMIKKNGWQFISPEQAFTESNWRDIFLEQPELNPEKPASLNLNLIDQTLDSYCVFS